MKNLFAGLFALVIALVANRSTATADQNAGSGNTAKPNIIFILADDCTYNLLGCYGGRDVKTPNIDSLARDGMKFERAYCASAMCAPFRAELYTGLYPMRNGVDRNHAATKAGTKSVAHYLGDLGYRVGLSGKSHVKPADCYPFTKVVGFPAGEGVQKFIASDSPFCLFLCSHNPHAAWTTGDPSQFDAEEISLAPVQHDNPQTREAMVRYLAEVGDLDREVGEVLAVLEKSGKADNTLVMFSSEQGWALGFAKWTNWDLGVHTGLVARWPGVIKPGVSTGALVQMADVVPTFIEVAGGDPKPNNLDGSSFLPVLLGERNEHREFVYGLHNNVPEGEPYPIRSIRDERFHYILNLRPKRSYHEKHVMAENSRLVWWPALKAAEARGDEHAIDLLRRFHNRPGEELYLVDEDPYELKNLTVNPDYAEDKKRLRTELERWMKEQGDSGRDGRRGAGKRPPGSR